jgi:hypothetical protein
VLGVTPARLRSVQVEDSILALRAVVDHRDDLIKQRTPDSEPAACVANTVN